MTPESKKPESGEPHLPDDVERLVSRFLDEEVSDEERRQLEEFMRRNRDAQPAVDEYFELERETRSALRSAFGTSLSARRRAIRWNRAARIGVAAVAASIVLISWQRSLTPSPADAPGSTAAAKAAQPEASWFAPPPQAMDSLAPAPIDGERTQIHIDKSDRNWLVVPGDRPGEFLVIEVKQTKRRTIAVTQDY